ncbi:DHA2 family efflux MFS transporter permease subunit [Peribacillus deserti]|uniref:MFS transporter n=1 Tax=Peribacillus deserti TaxID=673318 RepID=A0A2N5M3Q8_9BACI|nr:DHA2 family efflux MFS transporter permease subunit [Peribacillus deserti]PLT29000.1 MFS transporter [Peribacillus deserti]
MNAQSENAAGYNIRQHIPLLSVLMLGLFLAILNQTLLNVAIPHLMNEFGVAATTIQWLSTGYMLVNGVLVPLSAFLIERFGVRKLFIFAMICFTAGTFICGISNNFSMMLTGRLIQAIGGGVLQPLVMTIILSIFPPEMRGKGMGIFGLAMMFAPAAGPTLSGWLIENYSWRVMFYGMVPLGLLVILFALVKLKDIFPPKDIKIDVFGAVASLVGFSTLLYGVSEAGSKGWSDPIVLSTTIIGIIFITVFVIQQLRSEKPLLDFRVFKYDIFSLATLINVIITVAMFVGMFLLPIYLQNLRGFTALQSGLLMLPGALVMLVMSPVSGILFDKVGPRPLAIVGLFITVVTTYEFTQFTMGTSYNTILAIYVIRSFGMSLLMMPIMTAGMNQLPRRLNSHGTAMSNTARNVSGSLGISFITTIFTNRTTLHLTAATDQMNTADPIFMQNFSDTVSKVAAEMHLPLAQAQQTTVQLMAQQANIQATVNGINDAFYWSTAISAIGFILSFFLRDVRKDKNFGEDIVEQKAAQAQKQDSEVLMLPAPERNLQS